jgi:DNA-binding GntR family transcriptional regulator
MAAHLQHIENKPLRERVLDLLREAIISGEFKPGQSVVESEVAAQLGVSRAPVREAIQTLSAEGLVEIMPYRGSVVRSLTRRDIEELYSLRAVLERFAIQRVIQRHDPESIAQLKQHFDAMLSAAQQGDLNLVNQVDRHFHDTLIAASDHHLLAMTWSNVSMRVRQVMALRNRKNSDLTQIAYNHLPIIEAIEAQDIPLAMTLIERHVASSGDLLAEMWDEDEAKTDATNSPEAS